MDDYLSPAAVAAKLCLHRATLYKLRDTDPTFPKPIFIMPSKPRFVGSEIEAWAQSKREAHDEPRPAAAGA